MAVAIAVGQQHYLLCGHLTHRAVEPKAQAAKSCCGSGSWNRKDGGSGGGDDGWSVACLLCGHLTRRAACA